jgi:hypothetical protein
MFVVAEMVVPPLTTLAVMVVVPAATSVANP